jgi:hypothetical protein
MIAPCQVAALCAGFCVSLVAGASPVRAQEAVPRSVWVNDGDDLGRLDFSSPTSAAFTYIGKLGVGATGPGGSTWSDVGGATANTMLDINWDAGRTALYGISAGRPASEFADSHPWTSRRRHRGTHPGDGHGGHVGVVRVPRGGVAAGAGGVCVVGRGGGDRGPSTPRRTSVRLAHGGRRLP